MCFRNILVNTPAQPTDLDAVAIAAAARIARLHDAKIKVFDVSSDFSWWVQHLSGGFEATIESIAGTKHGRLQKFANLLSEQGLEATSRMADGRLSEAIIHEVENCHHDLVVKVAEAGVNRSGIIGSTDMRLLHESPCATLILKSDKDAGFQRVAVAVDVLDQNELQQRLDRRGIRVATMLAEKNTEPNPNENSGEDSEKNPIALIYALPPLEAAIRVHAGHTDIFSEEQFETWNSGLQAKATAKLARLIEQTPHAGLTQQLLVGPPEEAIPEFTNAHGIDLLVIGSVAGSSVQSTTIGHTAERILERVTCSVLVLKTNE